jgi:hypothetical protein
MPCHSPTLGPPSPILPGRHRPHSVSVAGRSAVVRIGAVCGIAADSLLTGGLGVSACDLRHLAPPQPEFPKPTCRLRSRSRMAAACGSRLHLGTWRRGAYCWPMPACQGCGQHNPVQARFCLACGVPLAAAPGERQESRKVVTILFSDVVGSTGLGGRLDPESLSRVMARFFEQARTIVQRHGGPSRSSSATP